MDAEEPGKAGDQSPDEERFRRQLAELKAREKKLSRSVEKEEEPSLGYGGSSRAMRYTLLGAEFAAIFFGFVYAGRFLDTRLGTHPWFILLGICGGFGIALYRLVLVARQLSE